MERLQSLLFLNETYGDAISSKMFFGENSNMQSNSALSIYKKNFVSISVETGSESKSLTNAIPYVITFQWSLQFSKLLLFALSNKKTYRCVWICIPRFIYSEYVKKHRLYIGFVSPGLSPENICFEKISVQV